MTTPVAPERPVAALTRSWEIDIPRAGIRGISKSTPCVASGIGATMSMLREGPTAAGWGTAAAPTLPRDRETGDALPEPVETGEVPPTV